jgi:hypothetical protein
MSTVVPAQLNTWIEDLRGQLGSGALADVGPMRIEPFYEVADLERWVRLTLREIDRRRAGSETRPRRAPGWPAWRGKTG